MPKFALLQLAIVTFIAGGMFYLIKSTTNPAPVPSAKAAISYSLRQFATGLTDPALMSIDSAGDMYVSQRGYETSGIGKIFKVSSSGSVSVFKDNIPTGQSGEKGLLGVEADSQYVYVYYTNTSGSGNAVARINKSTKQIEDIFTGIPAGNIHNAGSIHFGNDGKLYVATGNTGNRDLSSDINSLGGKILRLNPDGTIPTDNPFVGKTGHDAIWAYGLRNPFTFNVDNQTGQIFVNDVGDGAWEEINELVKGGNYGYPTCEGRCNTSGLIDPIYQFPNPSDETAAITGGAFWKNGYFFSDFKQTDLGWVDRYDLTTKTVTRAIASAPEPFAMDVNPTNGKLYMLSGTGVVYEIADADTGSTPIPTRIPSNTPIPQNNPPQPQIISPVSDTLFTAGQTISFSGSATDPNNDPVSLSWDVRLYHVATDPHNHPFMTFTGPSGSFVIPNQNTETDHDIWYRLALTATDSKGATATITRDIYPKKSAITLTTQPAGLAVLWDSASIIPPLTETNVEGMRRSLNVVSPQVINGRTYRFSAWSDGSAQSHLITIPVNDTIYTASFTEVIGVTPIPTSIPTPRPSPTSTPRPSSTPTPKPSSTPSPTLGPVATSTPIPTTLPPGGSTSLGNTQVANPIKLDNTNNNILHGIQIRPDQNTSVTTGSIYLGNVQAGTNVGLALYTNTSDNKPGTRMAQSASQIAVSGWNQLPLTASLAANTTYWLLTNNDARSSFANNISFTNPLPSNIRCVYGAMPYKYEGTFPTAFTSIPTSCSMYFSMAVGTTQSTDAGLIRFDGAPLGALAEWPAGTTWSSAWMISPAWGKFTTRNLSLTKTSTQGAVYFNRLTSIVSVEVYNGGTSGSMVTISCGAQTKTELVPATVRMLITTNFTTTCQMATLSSSNGWDTNFDNLLLFN